MKKEKIILLNIDNSTEWSNATGGKFVVNPELYDVLVKRIEFMIEDWTVYFDNDIDFNFTRRFYENGNNGHCIYVSEFHGGGYISAQDFTIMAVRIEEDETTNWYNNLSEFCSMLSEKYKVDNWYQKDGKGLTEIECFELNRKSNYPKQNQNI